MFRFIKVAILLLGLGVFIMFLYDNVDILGTLIQFKLNDPLFTKTTYYSMELPLIVVLVIALLAGGFASLAYLFGVYMEKVGAQRQLKASQAKSAALEKELNDLRNMPLEKSGFGTSTETTSDTTEQGAG
jgi:uncharacterized membrane protein (DUF106 family)